MVNSPKQVPPHNPSPKRDDDPPPPQSEVETPQQNPSTGVVVEQQRPLDPSPPLVVDMYASTSERVGPNSRSPFASLPRRRKKRTEAVEEPDPKKPRVDPTQGETGHEMAPAPTTQVVDESMDPHPAEPPDDDAMVIEDPDDEAKMPANPGQPEDGEPMDVDRSSSDGVDSNPTATVGTTPPAAGEIKFDSSKAIKTATTGAAFVADVNRQMNDPMNTDKVVHIDAAVFKTLDPTKAELNKPAWNLQNYADGTYVIQEQGHSPQQGGPVTRVEVEGGRIVEAETVVNIKFARPEPTKTKPKGRTTNQENWRQNNDLFQVEGSHQGTYIHGTLDDAGHLFRDHFGYGNHVFNLVPQDPHQNEHGEWKTGERNVQKYVEANGNVRLKINPKYDDPNSPYRPTELHVAATTDTGDSIASLGGTFKNPLASTETLGIIASRGSDADSVKTKKRNFLLQYQDQLADTSTALVETSGKSSIKRVHATVSPSNVGRDTKATTQNTDFVPGLASWTNEINGIVKADVADDNVELKKQGDRLVLFVGADVNLDRTTDGSRDNKQTERDRLNDFAAQTGLSLVFDNYIVDQFHSNPKAQETFAKGERQRKPKVDEDFVGQKTHAHNKVTFEQARARLEDGSVSLKVNISGPAKEHHQQLINDSETYRKALDEILAKDGGFTVVQSPERDDASGAARSAHTNISTRTISLKQTKDPDKLASNLAYEVAVLSKSDEFEAVRKEFDARVENGEDRDVIAGEYAERMLQVEYGAWETYQEMIDESSSLRSFGDYEGKAQFVEAQKQPRENGKASLFSSYETQFKNNGPIVINKPRDQEGARPTGAPDRPPGTVVSGGGDLLPPASGTQDSYTSYYVDDGGTLWGTNDVVNGDVTDSELDGGDWINLGRADNALPREQVIGIDERGVAYTTDQHDDGSTSRSPIITGGSGGSGIGRGNNKVTYEYQEDGVHTESNLEVGDTYLKGGTEFTVAKVFDQTIEGDGFTIDLNVNAGVYVDAEANTGIIDNSLVVSGTITYGTGAQVNFEGSLDDLPILDELTGSADFVVGVAGRQSVDFSIGKNFAAGAESSFQFGVSAEASGSTEVGPIGAFGAGGVTVGGFSVGADINLGFSDGVLEFGFGGKLGVLLGFEFDVNFSIDFKEIGETVGDLIDSIGDGTETTFDWLVNGIFRGELFGTDHAVLSEDEPYFGERHGKSKVFIGEISSPDGDPLNYYVNAGKGGVFTNHDRMYLPGSSLEWELVEGLNVTLPSEYADEWDEDPITFNNAYRHKDGTMVYVNDVEDVFWEKFEIGKIEINQWGINALENEHRVLRSNPGRGTAFHNLLEMADDGAFGHLNNDNIQQLFDKFNTNHEELREFQVLNEAEFGQLKDYLLKRNTWVAPPPPPPPPPPPQIPVKNFTANEYQLKDRISSQFISTLRDETQYVKAGGVSFDYLKTEVLAPSDLLDGWSGADRDRLKEIFDLYANEHRADGSLQKNEWEAFVNHLSRLNGTSESDARTQGADAAEQQRLRDNRAWADKMNEEFFSILDDALAWSSRGIWWGNLVNDEFGEDEGDEWLTKNGWAGTYRDRLKSMFQSFGGNQLNRDQFAAFIQALRDFKSEYGS